MNFFEQRISAEIEKDIKYRKKNKFDQVKRPEGMHTIGDFISAVFKINNKADAALFYRGYLEWLSKLPKKEKSGKLTDEQVAKSNIGWCFGEGMDSKMIKMWNKVTGAAHPIFGAMTPTPEEAFKAGMKLARGKK